MDISKEQITIGSSRSSNYVENFELYAKSTVLTGELVSHASISKKNLDAVNGLKNSTVKCLEQRFDLDLTEIKLAKLAKLVEEKNTANKELTELQTIISHMTHELRKTQKSITELTSIINKNKAEEVAMKQSLAKIHQDTIPILAAFKKAKKYCMTAFGMDINVESYSADGESYTCVVNFDENVDRFIKFIINAKSHKVIDFESDGLLDKEVENDLRIRFQEDGNSLALICSLRKCIL